MAGLLGIPELELAPGQEVGPAEIETEAVHRDLLGPAVRQGVAALQGLQTQERAVTHEPGARPGVVVDHLGGHTRPERVEVAVVLAPVVVRIDFQQLACKMFLFRL